MLMRCLALLALPLAVWAQPRASIAFQCVAEELDAAGVACSAAQPCPIYVELTSLEAVGSKLFVGGNLHSADATLSSILLASEDGGQSWTEPHTRIRSAGLDQMQFIDFETGWIAGQVLQGNPRDAFLLVTRDGGRSWQFRPLFDESRGGVIEQFWFDSKNNGMLLIDRMRATETGARHELYESRTGGDSWTLLQVSARPLAIKGSRAAQTNPDWRIRADVATRAYAIEHREKERWRAVASFPIRIAECQPAEPAALEPPPPEQPPAESKPLVIPRRRKP